MFSKSISIPIKKKLIKSFKEIGDENSSGHSSISNFDRNYDIESKEFIGYSI